MHYAVVSLRGVRMAVVLVERGQLVGPRSDVLIAELQAQLATPVMLVSRDGASWKGAKAKAHFDAEPYLFALLSNDDDVEWVELPAPVEAELPF